VYLSATCETALCYPVPGVTVAGRPGLGLDTDFSFKIYIKMVVVIVHRGEYDTFMLCAAVYLCTNVRKLQSSL